MFKYYLVCRNPKAGLSDNTLPLKTLAMVLMKTSKPLPKGFGSDFPVMKEF